MSLSGPCHDPIETVVAGSVRRAGLVFFRRNVGPLCKSWVGLFPVVAAINEAASNEVLA